MSVLDIAPDALIDVELIIGDPTTGDDFRKHVDSVQFVPTAATFSWTGLGKNTHTSTTAATWAVALSYAQDWTSPTSLSRYLYEHEGETVAVQFRPVAGGAAFTANVTITPGAIGGPVNTYAVATVTLGCDRPAIVTTA